MNHSRSDDDFCSSADDEEADDDEYLTATYEDEDDDDDDLMDPTSNERDEYHEVEKSTQLDTIRLQLWRVIVTIVLLTTTLAVTVTTYYVLEAENEADFEYAVRSA